MNEEEINTTEEDEYLEALESVPEEVRKFLWSDAFTLILKTISAAYKLNSDQEAALRRVTMETLVGNTTPIARRVELTDAGIVGELQDNILEAINEEFISRAIAQVEDYKELSPAEDISIEKTTTQNQNINAPSPMQALANIQERLSKPSTVAPITRDYSVTRPAEPLIPKTDTSPRAPSMDIYREIPDK